MNSDERNAAISAFLEDVDWNSYDYTKAPGADMKFPDFTDAQVAAAPPWIPKHYNATREWKCVHVPDLNQIADGEERRLFALYGVPVSWPKKDDGLDDLLDALDAAREEGGETWADAMDQHGLLNDEHYDFVRGRSLGFPEQHTDYDQTVSVIAKIDGDPRCLLEHGFRDLAHFSWFKKKIHKAKAKAWEQHDAILKQTFKALDERFEKKKAALSNELSAFKGVPLEAWAGAIAQLAQAKPMSQVLEVLGLEQPQWDEINAEWMARMSRDTTATIATVYRQALTGNVSAAF